MPTAEQIANLASRNEVCFLKSTRECASIKSGFKEEIDRVQASFKEVHMIVGRYDQILSDKA